MDTDSLSFHCEEHFPVFESSNFLNIDDESQSTDETAANKHCWEWDVERELNGDVALIPMSSEVGMNYLSNSPPTKEDFQKIMSDWQHFINIEIPDMELPTYIPLSADEEHVTYVADTAMNPSLSTRDIPTLSPSSLNLEFSVKSVEKSACFQLPRPAGKKIDMNAQCYIVEENETAAVKPEPTDGLEEDDDEDHISTRKMNFIKPKIEQIGIVSEEITVCPKLEPGLVEQPEQKRMVCSDSDRIDMENDYVDVDTISNHDTPILQAGDLNSLLEQFEATETSQYFEPAPEPPTEEELFEVQPHTPRSAPVAYNEPSKCQLNRQIAAKLLLDEKLFALDASMSNSAPTYNEPTNSQVSTQNNPEPSINEKLVEFQSPAISATLVACSGPTNAQVNAQTSPNVGNEDESEKRKQILDALPQELIMRIKASSKRKMIPVIDPIPAKRRGMKKPQIEVPQTPQEKVEKCSNPESIQLDHDYCSLATPYPKYPKKDSGFESAEEDEQRNILRNQPTVKGANGKLMVSLLKVNTLRNNIGSENDNKKKRKLNLEEYKKRREGFIRSCDNSQSNSPSNSGRNSPVVVEDEKDRLLKHQQKLMQMAAEVLKTPPKSARKSAASTAEEFVSAVPPAEDFAVPPPPRILPDNVEVKVLVSIGVNTNSALASKEFDVPVTELEEIKPLLQNANAKISNNSLITSVIENIQNKKKTQDTSTCAQDKTKKGSKERHHGEDKTIVYLDKNRPAVVTDSVEVQTDTVGEADKRQHARRRNSSSASNDHRKSGKLRSNSNDSHYSYSSQSSCSSASRSRSRSPSPRRNYNRKRYTDLDRERIREVEERRIVYVGGISSTMTKEALQRRFEQYGPISNVSVHFREYGDNYGFVTFAYKVDAYEAVEHGNDDPMLPHYDLSFGGRRIFCRTHYADLDNVQDEMGYPAAQVEDSFDNLLREAQAKLRKRKSCT